MLRFYRSIFIKLLDLYCAHSDVHTVNFAYLFFNWFGCVGMVLDCFREEKKMEFYGFGLINWSGVGD